MKPAFSTVACPEWPLDKVADVAEAVGALGVELRTFGAGSTEFACDPVLTSTDKVRQLFDKAGIVPCSLATSISFDEPIDPPVLGRVFDHELSVREAKGAIDLARELEVPFVRVFPFELHGGESRAGGIARIVDRLAKAADHCRNTGVRLLVENGGSFPTAVALADLLDKVGSPLVFGALSPSVALAAGESPASGINVLSDRLGSVKLKDFAGRRPCALGEGSEPVGETIDALSKIGYEGWIVYEFDRAWLGSPAEGTKEQVLPEPADVLRRSMKYLYDRIPHRAAGRRTNGATLV